MRARHNRWAENNNTRQWFEQSPAVQHLTHTMYMDDSRLPQGCYKWLNFNHTHTISSATGSASWLVTVDIPTTSALDKCWTEGLDWLNMDWSILALICVHFTLHGVTHPSLAMWLSWCHSAIWQMSHLCLGRSTPREAESAVARWWWWPQLTTSLCSQGFSLFLTASDTSWVEEAGLSQSHHTNNTSRNGPTHGQTIFWPITRLYLHTRRVQA